MPAVNGQLEFRFFKDGDLPPTPELRWAYLNPDRGPTPKNPQASPYYGFVGNRKAVQQLMRIDFDILGRYNHLCRAALAFIGPHGCGKTDLARRHANANMLPMVEISAKAITSLDGLLDRIKQACLSTDLNLIEVCRPKLYKLPPLNVFVDDADVQTHLAITVLSNGTADPDHILETETGYSVDCCNVHWMLAMTDVSDLPQPIRARFTPILLSLCNQEEVSQLIKLHYPSWDIATCRLVAQYCPQLPAMALSFAADLYLEHSMTAGPWEEAAARVASARHITTKSETSPSSKRETLQTDKGVASDAGKPLPDLLAKKLWELLSLYGRSLIAEPTRLQGLLMDACPTQQPRIRVLINALKLGIAVDLSDSSSLSSPDLVLSRWARRLKVELLHSDDVSRWVVETWAFALQLTKRSPEAAERAKVKQSASEVPAGHTPPPGQVAAGHGVVPVIGNSLIDPNDQELARLQQEGERLLTQFLYDVYSRTQGKPTDGDSVAANDLRKRYRIPSERAKQIVRDVREQWMKTYQLESEGTPKKFFTNTSLEAASPERFFNNLDNTITDRKHKLMWVKNPGLIDGNFSQDGVPLKMDWESAIQSCKTLCYLNYSDWRLPTLADYNSLYDDKRNSNPCKYLESPISFTQYWTSTRNKRNEGQCWYIFSDSGEAHSIQYACNRWRAEFLARPVRSIQKKGAQGPPAPAAVLPAPTGKTIPVSGYSLIAPGADELFVRLKRLGAVWDSKRRVWEVPEDNLSVALSLSDRLKVAADVSPAS